MDERAFFLRIGKPIPEWDIKHRLPIFKSVGPECRDAGTIFKINSKYMDVTDQPYLIRQWQAAGVAMMLFGVASGIWIIYLTRFLYGNKGNFAFDIMGLFTIIGSAYLMFKYGRDEYFSLKRRPIRFHRGNKKIYSIRRQTYPLKQGKNDTIKEIKWNESSIFCIHKGRTNTGDTYHIRYYEIDNDGNVISGLAIGREWIGKESFEEILSQWNYWCTYMNQGPEHIPKPMLFFSEKETPLETFLFCMYDFGGAESVGFRLFSMPFILLNTAFRLLSMWTCRDPIWPASVEETSVIDDGDPYEQPCGDTPVGWGPTAIARARGDYPSDPHKVIKEWRGQKNPEENAYLWAADIPPRIL